MSTRRPAFDPSRLEDDLDGLLPPPLSPPPSQTAIDAATVEVEDLIQSTAGTANRGGEPLPLAHTATARAGRGGGGRPSGPKLKAPAAGPLVTAVRIPTALFTAVVEDLLGAHIERPSYAQVVVWTCEDHRAEVIAEIEHAQKTSSRQPRGRKLASGGVLLTLRFQPGEQHTLDDVIAAAGPTVTRTAAVTAALRVAVKHGLSATA